ncbi:YqgQ family protein [Sporosarcina sp. E16_3]|uniref:YqgQ family protein n=1 Tax=unclassified Sporosarcina TaxID=2647733 RepID=UPI001645379D|nr:MULTISPECIES: YqgQ family protein [unclassified Sporosarcina]MBO0600345.1 YqgQ family protein [Sporosarcina sp. E16_3]
MKDYFGVLQLLKRFGIYVYTGNRKDDIDMVQSEVKDLYDNGLLMKEDYLKAVLILRSEAAKL